LFYCIINKNIADIFLNVRSRDSFKIYIAVQIILIPDILESVLDAKDTETKSLRRQLQDIESKLMVHTYEKSIDTNNLRVQLEEKCKKIQELEDKVARLEKVDLKYYFIIHIINRYFIHLSCSHQLYTLIFYL